MKSKENLLRTINFENPECIPMTFHINAACWSHYDRNELCDLIEEHPFLFPDFKRPPANYKPVYSLNAIADKPYTDPWGCVWETYEDGIAGTVQNHPLATWDNFAGYTAPNPEITNGVFPEDWDQVAENIKKLKAKGAFIQGGLYHGHTFLRLQDIRGYQNLMYDMCDEKPELFELIEMVENFNQAIVDKWIELEPDVITFPEDLGMQSGPMITPEHFRKYIKPVYQRMMAKARQNNIPAHMHSDGDIRLLADDLIDGGVEIINLQDLVNGIDWLADKYAGKVCIDLDIDRQSITPFGTAEQIDNLVREEVEKLGSKAGGLMMIYGLYPGVPLKNAKAVMDTMEKYSGYYS